MALTSSNHDFEMILNWASMKYKQKCSQMWQFSNLSDLDIGPMSLVLKIFNR